MRFNDKITEQSPDIEKILRPFANTKPVSHGKRMLFGMGDAIVIGRFDGLNFAQKTKLKKYIDSMGWIFEDGYLRNRIPHDLVYAKRWLYVDKQIKFILDFFIDLLMEEPVEVV